MPKPKQPNNNDDSLSSSSTCNNTVAIQQLRFSVAIDVNDGQESGCNNHEHHLQHSIFTTDNLSYQDSTLSQCSKMIILKELIRTENLYLNYFEILKEKIIQSLSRCNILTPEEVEKTFCLSQLNILFKVNTELLNQFKQVESLLMTNQQSSPTLMPTNGSSPRARNSLGQTFLRLTPFLKNYVQYSHMLEPCLIQFRNRKLKDKSFKAIVKKLQRFCTKLLFDALGEDDSCEKCNEFEIIQTMKMPLRRILYYRDVLTQLLKLTPITNDEYSPLSESLKLIEIVSQSFEQQITELDHKDKFYEINKKVLKQSENGEIISIAKPNRRFIYENEMYMTATRNLALSHHSERRRKSSKLSRTGLDIDAIHRSETNTRFFEDVSNHCVGFLFNDMIMICSTHFSTPQTPRTGLRETASKKKRIQETDALLGKKSMRYKSHISLEFDPDSPLIWIRNIISDHDFSHMFQLVTKDVIYTFKMKSEDIKTRWMNAIQSTIESFKKKNGQDVFIENGRKSFQQIVSRGYLDIPEAWILPSILRIQSLARTYLACLKTQRIKKKSRKNPKTKLDSVIQKVSQLDNILLQNQSFVESYPKKQASAVTILQNYEEDVNENYIEDQQEDSEEEETPLSTNVTTSISTISQPTRRSTITPRGTPSTPVVLNSSSPREFENRDNNQDKKIQHSTNSVAIEPQQQQQVETKTNHLESHSQKPVEMTADNVSAIPSSNNPSNLLNSEMYAKEIVYEDEFGKEYVVRIGDEIIYEDDFGNQVSEIVTLEKFLEMLENAKQEELMKASTSMQHQVAEKQQVFNTITFENSKSSSLSTMNCELGTINDIHNSTMNMELNSVSRNEQNEENVSSEHSMSASDDPKSFDLKHSKDVVTTNIHDIKVEKSNLETSSEIATTNNTNNNSNLNSRTIVTISQEEELLTSNHASASTTENSLQLPQQVHQDDDNNFNSMNSGNNENHRLSTESNTTTSSTHSKASNSGSDISKRPIAPWQEELLSKYKNDGKFKFVTQTAEQKLSTITTTQQQASSPEQHAASSMSTLGSSSLTPTTERIAKISPGVHHKESVRVSADFHNFLNKFKTIEQKTKEEQQVLTSPRGHHFSSSTSRDTKSEHHSDQQQ